MYRRITQRLTLRTAIALTICIALLPIPSVSLLISGAAQGQREERKGKPKPGKPEGVWPDLEEVKQEKQIEREPVPPVPSTIRSAKNPLQPWNGRRVGDPGTHRDLGQSTAEGNNKVVAEGIDKLSARSRKSRTKKRQNLGTLVDVATMFFAQSGQLFTRERPPGSQGTQSLE